MSAKHPPDPDQPTTDDERAKILARAYRLILSWPCPTCGKPFPCQHDLDEANDTPQPQPEPEEPKPQKTRRKRKNHDT